MKNYKCYIASNKESKAFDSVNGISAKSAIAAAKRKYSKDKYDLCFCGCYRDWETDKKKNYNKQMRYRLYGQNNGCK